MFWFFPASKSLEASMKRMLSELPLRSLLRLSLIHIFGGHSFYLMEHDTYGDEAACIIVDERGKLVLDDVYNLSLIHI